MPGGPSGAGKGLGRHWGAFNLYSSHTSRTRPSGAEWGGVVPSKATFVDK